MEGSERRAIPEIHPDRAQHDLCASLFSEFKNVLQVAVKVMVDGGHSRVICPNLLMHEHLHPAPLAVCGPRFLGPLPDGIQELPGAGGFQIDGGPDQGQRGRLRPKNGSGPEWSNHFVVAHVNHPDIAVGAGAITGNGEDDATIVGSGNASRTEGFETTLLFFHFGWRAAGTPLSSRSRNFKSQIWFSMSGLWRIECPPSRPHPISPVGRERVPDVSAVALAKAEGWARVLYDKHPATGIQLPTVNIKISEQKVLVKNFTIRQFLTHFGHKIGFTNRIPGPWLAVFTCTCG